MNLSYYPETITENDQFLTEQEMNSAAYAATSESNVKMEEKEFSSSENGGMQVLRKENRNFPAALQESVMLFCSDPASRNAMIRFLEAENIKLAENPGTAFPEKVGEEVALFLIDSATFNNKEQFCRQLAERYPDLPIVCMDEPSTDVEIRKRIARFIFACIIKPLYFPRFLNGHNLIEQAFFQIV